ncbi:MAG TPA: hypothetical protein VFT70_06555 [Nocardioides sp.]|nr:hypothetical protein [Nocardioides sp.]
MSQDPQHAAAHHRINFEFVGALDDAPTIAAAGLARVARLLLAHADQHTGQLATVRISLSGPRLSLSLRDPECSPACLERTVALAELEARDVAGPRRTHLVAGRDRSGGLSLDWVLEPSRSHPRSVLRRWHVAS